MATPVLECKNLYRIGRVPSLHVFISWTWQSDIQVNNIHDHSILYNQHRHRKHRLFFFIFCMIYKFEIITNNKYQNHLNFLLLNSIIWIECVFWESNLLHILTSFWVLWAPVSTWKQVKILFFYIWYILSCFLMYLHF